MNEQTPSNPQATPEANLQPPVKEWVIEAVFPDLSMQPEDDGEPA